MFEFVALVIEVAVRVKSSDVLGIELLWFRPKRPFV